MNHPNDMDGDIKKLLTLLKKILKNHPQGSDQLSKFLDHKADPTKSLNLNLCFFTFIPMSPEELMEFEEMYEDYLNEVEDSGRREETKLEFKLNTDDLDFLRKNGIRFN